MKNTALPAAIAACLIALTVNVQAAEGIYHWPLQIAIDDGTTDKELFVELDHRTMATGRDGATKPTYVAIQAVTVIPSVIITSDQPIGERVRDAIRAVFLANGHAEPIEFVDSASGDTRIEQGGDTM